MLAAGAGHEACATDSLIAGARLLDVSSVQVGRDCARDIESAGTWVSKRIYECVTDGGGGRRARRGMQVNVTLFWFVLPKWFMDMGGFEKEENIAEFVEWGRLAFQLFGGTPAFASCRALILTPPSRGCRTLKQSAGCPFFP